MSARLLRLVPLAALAFFFPVPAAAAPPELPDQIAAAWRTDHLYLYPAMRPSFPQAELDRIRAATRTVNFPVYVALLPRTPLTRSGDLDLPTLLQARVGQPGLYLVWTVTGDYWSGEETLIRPGGLKGRSLTRVQLDDKWDHKLVTTRPAPGIVRTIQQAATAYDGRPLPDVPAGDLEPADEDDSGPSTTDKEDLSVFIGMGAGGLAGFLLVIGLTLRHQRRRPSTKRRPRSTQAKTSSSKAGTPARITSVQLQADRWIAKADRAVRSLEARITASDRARAKVKLPELLDQRDDAAERLAAARALRSAAPEDLAATAGALVLARQAQQAAGGKEVQPPCFFDPTHQPGSVQAAWTEDTEVPTCPACARILARGETPRGFRLWKKSGLLGLDRKAVPYWTLDPKQEPLLATGFGALEDDLADRVERVYGVGR
ncbi:hypothetical protein EV138_3733 [Kribbella voronezhensis]|uniref:Uncharacterized protein n=1 Tax=Kribbella voronezhensis TaxID=2512212 RepID=A0A4R7TEE7_9ACTN|nr:hypothetical protein [Kribbella voronezhensis]TDU90149.1 hypothetical protein EV138_3733 [Kribbella voronezhensis]